MENLLLELTRELIDLKMEKRKFNKGSNDKIKGYLRKRIDKAAIKGRRSMKIIKINRGECHGSFLPSGVPQDNLILITERQRPASHRPDSIVALCGKSTIRTSQ